MPGPSRPRVARFILRRLALLPPLLLGVSLFLFVLTHLVPADPAKLIALVQQDGRYRFAGPDKIRIERASPTLEERVALVESFLARLT